MTQHATDGGATARPDADNAEEATTAAQPPAEPAEPAAEPADGSPASPTLLEQMGGVSGLVSSTIPVLVFVVVNALTSLTPAIWAALGVAAAIAVLRLVRREGVQPAVSGALGVGIGALIAYRMGEAKGFFLFGIWASLVYGSVFAGSLLIRRPLIGVIWHALRGDGRRWRADPRIVRGYDIATLTWTLVFGARFIVQQWLYDNDETGALGVARLAMGLPLTAVAAVVTVWAVGRANRALASQDGAVTPAEPAGQSMPDGASEDLGTRRSAS